MMNLAAFLKLLCLRLFLVALLLVIFSASAFAEVKVEVRLFDTVPAPIISRVTLSGRFQSRQAGSMRLLPSSLVVTQDKHELRLASRTRRINGDFPQLVLTALDSNGICIKRETSSRLRCYAGTVSIAPLQNGSLFILNTVSKRDYLVGVLAAETLPNWPLEALKAQAVLSQTRLLRKPAKRNAFGEPVVSISDSTTDEAYGGIRKNNLLSQAVDSVWGEVLAYDNRPIEAFYHSTCAGHTSDDGYFSGAAKSRHAYSVGVTCPYCKLSPFYKEHVSRIPNSRWQASFPQSAQLYEADSSSRYRQANDGKQSSAYLLWLRLGQTLGWDKAPGTLFMIQQSRDMVIVKSRGAGHGVGLCQWGAAGMARQGFGYQDILRFYYPKASLQKQ